MAWFISNVDVPKKKLYRTLGFCNTAEQLESARAYANLWFAKRSSNRWRFNIFETGDIYRDFWARFKLKQQQLSMGEDS